MTRYTIVDMSPRLLPVDLEAQLGPASIAHAAHHVVDALDLSEFDAHYRNDVIGASALAPGMLLKAVLLAYSQGRGQHVGRVSDAPSVRLHVPWLSGSNKSGGSKTRPTRFDQRAKKGFFYNLNVRLNSLALRGSIAQRPVE